MSGWAEYIWRCSICGFGIHEADHDRRQFPTPRVCDGQRAVPHLPRPMDLTVTPLVRAESAPPPPPTVEVVLRRATGEEQTFAVPLDSCHSSRLVEAHGNAAISSITLRLAAADSAADRQAA